MDVIMEIAGKERVGAITTLIDVETEVLGRNRSRLSQAGILPLCPDEETAHICLDKYAFFEYTTQKGLPTPLTFRDIESFRRARKNKQIEFPVFVKPVRGAGSVGAQRVSDDDELMRLWDKGGDEYIIQELMNGDCGADVYVDAISGRVVSAFTKRKIETRIGGASKTISFHDSKLFEFIEAVVDEFNFAGPVDMDFFIREDGTYVLSEINPRFGGAYLHAYGAGVNFFTLIKNNMEGHANARSIGRYQDDLVMMMYDDVVIRPLSEMLTDKIDPL